MRLRAYKEVPREEWVACPMGRKTEDKKREPIRQWVISELADNYSYPRDWLAAHLQFFDKGDAAQGVPAGFFGFCLNSGKGDPFLWVSVERPGNAGKAEQRLREVLRQSAFSRLGMCTDGTAEGTRCLRQRSNSGECDFVLDVGPFTLPDGLRSSSPFRSPGAGKTGPVRMLEPISESLEDVFFEAHSHIRDIDGLHPDEALDELCKILYAKLYDEEMTPAGEPYSMQRGRSGTAEEFAAVIRRVYTDANEYDVRVFSLKVPGYDRSRGVFNSPIRLSSPAAAKVVETLESYWLSRSSIDVKGRAFQRVLGASQRAGMGQYFTPREVIQLIVAVTAPTVTDLILDPFSGSGHFLSRSLDVVRANARDPDHKRLDEFAFNKLHGIEKSDRMVRVAMTDMRLHGDGHSNIRCTDALLAFSNYPDIRPDSFDVIMTNPPFGSLLGPEAIARLGKFALADGRRSVPLEVLGLERCIQFLRPGGKLGIVLPDGVLANRGTGYVRAWASEHLKLRAIVSLPIETFCPFGANIKTSVLFGRKWKSGERRSTDYQVCLAKAENVGYDAMGRPQAGSDLNDVAEAVAAFIRTEGW
jgi:type I restriction enzyme M protein